MDYGQLAAELVRARRGNRTQKSLGRALGYRSNVVFAWENRHDEPSARSFFRLVQKTGSGTLPSHYTIYRGAPPNLTSRKGVAEFLRGLAADRKLSELSGLLERDRYAVSRWLRGQTEIPLGALLHFVEVTTLGLYDFLAAFVDPAALPSAASGYAQVLAARRAAIQMPWSAAIVHMADLPSYRKLERHEPGWFASRLGVTTQEETACLEHLVASGQMTLEGGRYRRAEALTVDTRPDPDGTRRLAAFWLEEGARRVLVPGKGRFSFNTFAVSRVDLEQIQRLQRDYFRKLRSLVEQSDPTEAVAVVTFQLIPLAVESQERT